MIEIRRAPPFATVQDLGRRGHRAEGVPPAGAMDPDALRGLNRSLGNGDAAAGIEWALGEGTLRFNGPVTVAFSGAQGRLAGVPVPQHLPVRCRAGDELHLGLPSPGRFGYLAVRGGVDVPMVLGSRSTYLPGRFGGLAGRLLRDGDRLPTGDQLAVEPAPLAAPPADPEIRVVRGPQGDLFDAESWERLLGGEYVVSAASDRMGYRLDGPSLRHAGPATLPSEPACPGAIQVPDGGTPIVLMPDGPTIGGYPKIAVVFSADLGRLAQLRPGSRPDFRLIELDAIRDPGRE